MELYQSNYGMARNREAGGFVNSAVNGNYAPVGCHHCRPDRHLLGPSLSLGLSVLFTEPQESKSFYKGELRR